MTYDELQSKSIDFLRFPLIVGVVFIHNYASTIIVQGVEIGNDTFMPVYHMASELFSQVIARIAVPLFFFISGFLFFLNVHMFNKDCYFAKLKKRAKTLLVPYLFWNIAFLLFYYLASHAPVLSSWFRGRVYDMDFILSALWGVPPGEGATSEMTYPIAYQFWFIRDLMVTVILTPLIYCLIKYLKIYAVAFLGVLWYLELWPAALQFHGLSSAAFFFFTLGAWFSVNGKNVIEEFAKIKYLVFFIYPIIALTDLFTKGMSYNVYINHLGILFGLLFCFNLVSLNLNKGKWKVFKFLSVSSFFVFAIHDPWLLSQIKKLYFKVFLPDTDVQLTVAYFIVPVFVVLFALGGYYLLKRYFPRFTQIITGGR